MDNETTVVNPQNSDNKTFIIGRMWDNSNDPKRQNEKAPVMRIVIDRDLGFNVNLTAGSSLVVFKNDKMREGKKDADFRIAISVPSSVAAKEIERRKAAKAAQSS